MNQRFIHLLPITVYPIIVATGATASTVRVDCSATPTTRVGVRSNTRNTLSEKQHSYHTERVYRMDEQKTNTQSPILFFPHNTRLHRYRTTPPHTSYPGSSPPAKTVTRQRTFSFPHPNQIITPPPPYGCCTHLNRARPWPCMGAEGESRHRFLPVVRGGHGAISSKLDGCRALGHSTGGLAHHLLSRE